MIFHLHDPVGLFRGVVVSFFTSLTEPMLCFLWESLGILNGSLALCPFFHGYAPSGCLFQRDDFLFVYLDKFNEMVTHFWTEAEGELATERNQIPPQGLEVVRCYQVLPLSAYSPSDLTVRLHEKQGEYLPFMSELRQIYAEKPDWLRLRDVYISRHIPVAYVSDDDWVGRGYVAVEMADDDCVVYDPDDGSFDFVKTANRFRLGIDHASIPYFSYKLAVAGVRPRLAEMWSSDVCSAFREKAMSSPLLIQVEMIVEGTVLAQAMSNDDGFSLDAWLAFNRHALLNRNRATLYPYLEEEQNVL